MQAGRPCYQQRKLLEFFKQNPDEELTLDDIAVKLDCSRRAAYNLVQRMQEKDHVECVNIVRLTPEMKARR